MLLSDIFAVDRIKVNLVSRTKSELFVEMVDFLEESGAISEPDRVMEALQQRENVMNTVAAPHVALPHASMWLFKKTVGAFGISHEGIDYEAEDKQPVHIVMMLIDDRYEANNHMTLLKKTARLINAPNFYTKIMACEDPQQVYDLIVDLEELQRI